MGSLLFMFSRMMFSGVGSMVVSGRDFWIGFATSTGFTIAGILLLYYLSVALISPLSANRALPIRIYLTVIWFLSALVCLGWVFLRVDPTAIMVWMVVSLVILIGSLVVIVSN